MANFKSNAARKRWLGLNKKKYAVGGLTPSTNMYGDNTIPYTASTVYDESSPEYQQQLEDQIVETQVDPSYRNEALSDLAKSNKIEGIGQKVGQFGLNKLTDKVVESGLEKGIEMPDYGEDAQGMFRAGKEAFQATRNLNKIYKGTATGQNILDASKTGTDAINLLSDFGKTSKTVSAVGTGAKAIASAAGPQIIGAGLEFGGKKWMEAKSDDDPSTITKDEHGGAITSSIGTGIGAGVAAGTIGTMAGIGAANIWNPFGWATLAATGIGAGLSYLNKRRKAKKAGKAMDAADAKQNKEIARLNRNKRIDLLKDRQYSGFDYGGDTQGPGFYKSGGVRKYQDTGVKDVLAREEGDWLGLGIQNPYAYNPSSRNDDIIAQNRAGLSAPEGARYINPENTFVSGMDPDDPNFLSIMQSQGGFPIGEAEVVGDFVPQDIPKGYDPYANNSTEQKIFDNLGMEGVLEYRQSRSNIHAATAPVGAVGATVLGGGALATELGGVGGSQAARWTGNQLMRPFQHYGGNAVNAWKGLRGGGGAWNMTKNAFKLGYNALSTKGVAQGYKSVAGQLGTELSGEGTTQNRLGTASDAMALFGGSKTKFANWLAGNKSFGFTPKEVTKISSDIADKDYLSAAGRTVLSPFADSSKGSWGEMFNIGGSFLNKATPNIQADDYIPGAIATAGSKVVGNVMNSLALTGNAPNLFDRASTDVPGGIKGYKAGGMRNLPGGKAIDIGNGATKYVGQTHKQGGIYPDPKSEVENNEIEAPVTLADGSTNPYIFSEYLNTDGSKGYNDGGESIANVAEGLATSGAPQSEFDKLARMQELAAGRSGNKIMDTTMAKYGGLKYQDRGVKKVPDTNVLGDDFNPFNAAKRLYYDYLAGEGAQSDQAGNILRLMVSPASTISMGIANAAYPFMSEEHQGKHEEMIGQHRKATKDLDKYKQTLIDERKYKTPWESIKGVVGYQDRGFKEMRAPTDFGGVPYPEANLQLQRGSAIQGGAISAPRLGGAPIWKPPGSAISGGAAKARVLPQYKEGGVRSYQTRGLVMSEDRQDQYDRFIKFIPGTGYVGPDGNLISENEADVVDWVNRGGLDSYNPNQGGNYMPSAEAMEGYAQEDFRERIINMHRLRGNDFSVVPPRAHIGANTPLNDQQAAVSEQGTQSSIPGVGTEARRQYYDDNNWAYDSTIPGFEESTNAVEVQEQNNITSEENNLVESSNEDEFIDNAPLIPDWAKNMGTDPTPEQRAASNKRLEEWWKGTSLSAKDKRKLKRAGNKAGREEWRKENRPLIQAAQFIPAAMAFMDKPDYMNKPNKIGGIDRVNLENVSLDDRQAAIKADSAAMQRFVRNSGMGSAGFAASMAGWQKKEGLAAAVTAEQQRLNTAINNEEAGMNIQIDARNKAIQEGNRQADMTVDQFNKESKAATNAQRVDAVETFTTGLGTKWMDQKKMDTTDRLGRAIEGQTKVLEHEKFRDLTNTFVKDNNLDIQPYTPEWYAIFEEQQNTTQKKFGGMRQIPRYGYSTK